jgi:hypothetical protein
MVVKVGRPVVPQKVVEVNLPPAEIQCPADQVYGAQPVAVDVVALEELHRSTVQCRHKLAVQELTLRRYAMP